MSIVILNEFPTFCTIFNIWLHSYMTSDRFLDATMQCDSSYQAQEIRCILDTMILFREHCWMPLIPMGEK